MTVPLLSAANWGGHGLHLRGNLEAYLGAASENKWLELHGLEHWVPMRGVGPFKHNDPHDRPEEIFGGTVTLYTGGENAPRVLLPVIPEIKES